MIYKVILTTILVILNLISINAKVQTRRERFVVRHETVTGVHNTRTNKVQNNRRHLKENQPDKPGGGGGGKPPSPNVITPAPAPAPGQDRITFSLQPVYLTTSSSSDPDEIKTATTLYIIKYFDNLFKVLSIQVSLKGINHKKRSRRNQTRLLRRFSGRKLQQQQQIYEISGTIDFEKDKAPTPKLMDLLSQTLFDDEYIKELKKKKVIEEDNDNVQTSISFTDPTENGNDDNNDDDKVVDGSGQPNPGDGDKLETIGGKNNSAGIYGGVIGAFALLCMASMLFVKMKRNKQDETQNGSRGGSGGSPFGSQIFGRTLRSFYLDGRYDGDSSMEEDLDDEHHKKKQYRQKPKRLRNKRGSTAAPMSAKSMTNNTDVISNDDASAFETVYSIPVSPSLQQFFSPSPERKGSSSIVSKRGRIGVNDNESVALNDDDDVYSLNGFVDDKPNKGDRMLDHVLSMNDYDENMIKNHDLSSDVSYSMMANEYSESFLVGVTPVTTSKKQTMKELHAAALKGYYSPEKGHIIVDRTATSSPDEGVDVIQVTPSSNPLETPMSFISSSTSLFTNLMDNVADDNCEKSSHHSSNISASDDIDEPLTFASRIVETERTEAIEIDERSTSNFSLRHKITVETSAPPPPQTPDRYPLQDIRQAQEMKKIGGASSRNYYDSESSADEYDSGDESTHYSDKFPPIQSKISKENYDPKSTSDRQRPQQLNRQFSYTSKQRIIPEYTRRIVNNTRDQTTIHAANARDARKKRLTNPTTERSSYVQTSTADHSKAERASNLRKMRLQQQKLALSPTKIIRKEAMNRRREV